MYPRLDTDKVREAARGKWLTQIYPALVGRQLDRAIKEWNPRGNGIHVECPVHVGKNGDAFRLYKDADLSGGGVCNTCGAKPDGFAMLMWIMDLGQHDFPKVKHMVAGVLGMVDGIEPAPVVTRSVVKKPYVKRDDAKIKEELNWVWDTSLGMDSQDAEPARKWLERRKLPIDIWAANPDVIRYHPGLDYYDSQLKRHVGEFPAIVALFFHSGKPFTIHRTYITQEGEPAPVSKFRKVMEHCGDEKIAGGYIPIGQPVDGYIGLAEGLETGLAVAHYTDLPCWPTTSWSHMAKVALPPGLVHSAILWADRDWSKAGQRGAVKAKQWLWEHQVRSRIEIPQYPIPDNKKGIDWDDVGRFFGRAGFPQLELEPFEAAQQVG